MKFNDVQLKCKDDYEFWYKWVSFLEIYLGKEPLRSFLKDVYVEAVTTHFDNPFGGLGFKHLLEEVNSKREKKLSYSTLSGYKGLIKEQGWLTPTGTLPQFLVDMRKKYRSEGEQGIKNVSLILKICVC